MKYWQIIYRTGEAEYITKEIIVDDNQYQQIQDVIKKGEDFIIIKDKPTIKRTSIASINEANNIVAEYQRTGIVQELGLKELSTPAIPRITGNVEDQKGSKLRGLERLKEWAIGQEWYRNRIEKK